MNKRNSVRYGSELLPGSLSKVTLSWGEYTLIGSYVVNYCANGISIQLPATLSPAKLPKEKDTVKVLMPIDELWFTGTCIYIKKDSDTAVSMGIYFYIPEEQKYLRDLLYTSLNVPAESHSFVSYEWEELVGRLCDSEDPELKKIGCHHRDALRSHQDSPQAT
jgi:hypothetical protein